MARVFNAWGFPQLCAAEAAVDLVDDGWGGDLVLQEGRSWIEHQRRDLAGRLIKVERAATGGPGYSVVSSELWLALRSWASLGAREAVFAFRSDRPLFDTAVTIVAERLERFAAGTATEEDRRVARIVGLGSAEWVLERSHVCAGSPAPPALVSLLIWRLSRLLGHGAGPQATEEALLALLVRCGAAASGTAAAQLTANEVAGLLGVDLPPTAAGPAGAEGSWSGHAQDCYRDACARSVVDSWGLDRWLAGAIADARILTLAASSPPAAHALDSGAAATAGRLARLGMVPAVIDLSGATPGSLPVMVARHMHHAASGAAPPPAAVGELLRTGPLVLIALGAEGCPCPRPDLVFELRAALRANARLRVIATAAAPRLGPLLGYPVAELRPPEATSWRGHGPDAPAGMGLGGTDR